MRQSHIESVIVNGRRMQLLVDPFVNPNRKHSFQISRARPESQPVQGLNRPCSFVNLWRNRLFMRNSQGKAARGEYGDNREMSAKYGHSDTGKPSYYEPWGRGKLQLMNPGAEESCSRIK